MERICKGLVQSHHSPSTLRRCVRNVKYLTSLLVSEVLKRSTSINDALNVLKNGTVLHKVRDKSLRGLRVYRRVYKLNIVDLNITYGPDKSEGGANPNCASPSGKDKNTIDISELCEVRLNHGTDVFNAAVKKSTGSTNISDGANVRGLEIPRRLCFSLVFKDNVKPPLDLVAEDSNTRDLWVSALSHLIKTIRDLGEQKDYELFLKKAFQKADKNGNKKLSFKEIKELMDSLNVKVDKGFLEGMFQAANTRKAVGKKEEEALDEEEFVTFYYSMLERPELDGVFQKYSKDSPDGRLRPEDLAEFQMREQKVELAVEECEKIIKVFEPVKGRETLSKEGM